MSRPCPFVKMLITIIDRDTKEVLVEQYPYESHVPVPVFAHQHPILYREHIEASARLLYLARMFNKYREMNKGVGEALEGRNWTLDVVYVDIIYPESK